MNWIKKRIKPKSSKNVDFITPTQEQESAISYIKEFLDSPTNHVCVIKGVAGTGKTTIVNNVLREYRDQGNYICVTSFTNKATNIISQKTPFAEGVTLFKLLGLRAEFNSENLIFKKQKLASIVKKYDIIVLDECSMVADEYIDLLVEECNKYWKPIKLLMMGDPFQLPPVGQETESKSFTFQNYFEMREVIRQSKYSNIFKYSLGIRNILEDIIYKNKRISITTKININKDDRLSDLYVYKESNSFIESMLNDFSSEEYLKNSDYVKVIAYRNKTVDALNAIIRRKLFGEKIPPICEGDELMLSAPVKDLSTGNFIFDTSDEIEIKYATKEIYENEEDHLGIKISFPYYFCNSIRKFDGLEQTLCVVHPEFKEDFNRYLYLWAEEIKKQKYKKKIFREEFYPFKDRFHTPHYNYAITTHKSQGSTYEKVYVVEDDIERVRKASSKDLWKSKYVACTRASSELHILNRNK